MGWAASFHNWTMLWDENNINLYLDGQPQSSLPVSDAATSSAWPNPFKQKAFMIVNQAIGGSQGGDPSHTAFPLKYQVDYIRVYQGGSPPPPSPAPPPPHPGSRSECMQSCSAAKADGCCEYEAATGVCNFSKGHHVQGGGGFPSRTAANCYAAGNCDGWNDGERCNPNGESDVFV